MSIVLQSSGGGSVTLQEPSTASNVTATLPASTGTVMVSGNMPAFSAVRSGAQTVANGTFTKIQFNSEEFDTNNCYDPTTNYRFTPTVAGYYQISGSVSYSFNSGSAVISIFKNGASFKWGNLIGAVVAGCSGNVSALIYLNGSTDYIELYAYQNSGLSQNISTSTVETYFQASMARTA